MSQLPATPTHPYLKIPDAVTENINQSYRPVGTISPLNNFGVIFDTEAF